MNLYERVIEELKKEAERMGGKSALMAHVDAKKAPFYRALSDNPEKATAPNSATMFDWLEKLGATITFPAATETKAPTIRHMGANSPSIAVHGAGLEPVPVYTVAGAGPAWELEAAEPIFTIVAPPSFAKESDFALSIDGESMYPTIKNGAVVGVQRGTRFRQGEIFAVRIPYEGLTVKRVDIDHDSGEYVLKSDNTDKAKYGDVRINIESAPHLLVGRVVWVWQGV